MLDNLKSMAGLAGILKDLPKIKMRMEQLKQRLADQTVTGESGGGAVRVTATGLLHVVSIDLDHALLSGLVDTTDPQDKAMAEDLIAGAVNAALVKAREMAEKEVAAVAGELGLPLPPGGLGGLIG
ncbi:MAG: YbaB/EbfC family nucleoid-associated protein [Planctomycetes bacterium]|nr:YbaB/EbfC family nucleoid-associated protein [Planctomycetota bacterium]